jgi:5-(carboxyamino)imidazole ribonucleotide synthase
MTSKTIPVLSPGATIGILGGGQLGRMLAQAAARLGLRCHVYSSESDACAFDVVRRSTLASFSDEAKLAQFAKECDVITYEFENVPAEAASFLAARTPVLPDPKVLATTQDRLIEKQFLVSLGIETAKFAQIDSAEDLARALKQIGAPAVLKTRRFGYDGKGQARVTAETKPDAAFREVGEQPSILEAFVPFEREVSVIATRGHDGQIVCFDVTENVHRHHILHTSHVPASISAAVADQARQIAGRIAQALGYIGVLGVEMFVVGNGEGTRVLVNEIAPRVHNSGHWTLDGASVSQFEQHIRAIAGWPLATPIRHGEVEMINLIGPEAENYAQWLNQPGTSLHLYGKTGARPGRKMGHVTRLLGKRGE